MSEDANPEKPVSPPRIPAVEPPEIYEAAERFGRDELEEFDLDRLNEEEHLDAGPSTEELFFDQTVKDGPKRKRTSQKKSDKKG